MRWIEQRLRRLWGRVGAAPADTQAAPRAAGRSVEAWQARAAERVLEDERTRGILTDAEFRPLERWALARTDALGARLAALPEAEAEQLLDEGSAALRALLTAASRTVGRRGELGPAGLAAEVRGLRAALRPPVFTPAGAEAAGAALEALAAELAAAREPPAGTALAARLAAALGGAGEVER